MVTSAWGIDLGTTNSCIARATADGVEVIHIDEAATVPSVLAFDGKTLLVGRRAANHAVLVPDQAVRSVKRHMGDDAYRVVLGGTAYSPVEVSAKILAYLKEQAEKASGETITDVVITVPAWFNEPQRRATMAAGALAGLKVTRIINEPTAAALAYGHSSVSGGSVPPAAGSERWLVYDLGGGTFDVSILSVAGSYKEVLASCGNTYLGGDDFDHRLVLRWVDVLRDRHNIDVSENRVAMAQLRHLAEQVKIRLSSEVEVRAQAVIDNSGSTLSLDELVTRDMLAEAIADYIDSTIGKVRQALEEAHVEPGALTRALLVGGSTRIPLVRARVAEELGIEPDAYVDVDLSVALGAAIQSALDHAVSSAQIVVDVAVHSLGVAALGREDEGRIEEQMTAFSRGEDPARDEYSYPYTFAPVIRKNTRLPARFVEEFATMVDNQPGIEVVVLQGESSNTRENTLVGAFHVELDPRPAQSPVYIGFEYDQSGMVRVTVSDQGGQKLLKAHTLDLGASAQSNSEMQSLRVLSGEHRDEDDEDDSLDMEGEAQPATVTNFLIEQVERQLSQVGADELTDIRAALGSYREMLAQGRDEEIDEVEERLYTWLDERKAASES